MLHLTLMNHHFEVPCEDSEREALVEAATLLEDKLDQVTHLKGENKILMVALNLCYDYVQMKRDTMQYSDHLEKQLEGLMQSLIEETKTQ